MMARLASARALHKAGHPTADGRANQCALLAVDDASDTGAGRSRSANNERPLAPRPVPMLAVVSSSIRCPVAGRIRSPTRALDSSHDLASDVIVVNNRML